MFRKIGKLVLALTVGAATALPLLGLGCPVAEVSGGRDSLQQTSDPSDHYSGVLLQQGAVQLDDDWNE